MSMTPIHVLVADTLEIVRRGVRNVLAADAGILVVGDAPSLPKVVASAHLLRPDTIVVGARMAQQGAVRALGTAREPLGSPDLVVLTTSSQGTARHVLGEPDARYLPEDVTAVRLVAEVLSTAAGSRSRRCTTAKRLAALPSRSPDFDVSQLTPRELDVVRLLSQGRTNSEIARSLSLSTGTVKVHLARTMTKTGSRNRLDLVTRAFRSGIVH